MPKHHRYSRWCPIRKIHLRKLPKDLPEFLEIDLGALKSGDVIHLSQIKLPKGVEIPELKLGKEHDVAVVIAKPGRVEAEGAEGEAAE